MLMRPQAAFGNSATRGGSVRCAGVLVIALVAAASVTTASTRAIALPSEAAKPTTLTTVPGRVYAVAESSRYVAWRGCDSVGVSDRRGHRLTTIHVPKSPGFGCQLLGSDNYGLIDHDVLAILGGTVTWSKWAYGNSTDYAEFGAAQVPSGHGVRSVLPSNLWLGDQGGPGGSYIVGPVSDGFEMLYGVTSIANDPSCTDNELVNGTCPMRTSGTLWRIDSQQHRKRIAAAAATLIAFGGGRVALVPHGENQPPDLGPTGRLFRQPQPIVLLLRMADGVRIGAVELAGEPYELALSPELGAALVGERTKSPYVHISTPVRLEWFNPRGNGSTHSFVVPAGAEALSVAGHRIIFRDGQRILSYVPGDKRPTVVAHTPSGSSLIGPVLSGSRLLWADYDNASDVSHIRVLNVSAI